MYHEHNLDSDMIRVLQLIQELSEQNARNKEMSAKLVGMSAQLKVCFRLVLGSQD